MADESSLKETSSTQVNCDNSDSSFEIKIKTIDLQIYYFRVNKNMSISTLKEEIVTKICVPIEQQRLLYKGKVLNNAQLLSELNLEEGETMYLVERQPVQSQPTSSTVVADTSRTSSSQGSYSGAGAESSQNTRRIQLNNPENRRHISLLPVPLTSMPFLPIFIPDALTTITEFIDRTEMVLQRSINLLNAAQHQIFSTNVTAEFLNTRREILSFILGRTEQHLRESVTTTISNLCTRLQRISSPSSQRRFGALHLIVKMRELGAMFLKLGRIIMCLYIEKNSEELFVNAGPAIFTSPIWPHPSVVQLFPSQSSYPSETNNPAYFRREQPVPIHLASRGFRPTTSTGYLGLEPILHPPPLSGSFFVPTLGAQYTARTPNVLSSNAQVQSSSNAVQSGVTQDFHAVVSSETQSDMSNTILQPPELPNVIMHETQMNVRELSDIEDLFLFNPNSIDGASDESEIVVGAEDGIHSSSEENHVSDLAVSGRVEQQEFMEVLRSDISRKLAKESSSMDKSRKP